VHLRYHLDMLWQFYFYIFFVLLENTLSFRMVYHVIITFFNFMSRIAPL
jgi:hypothetical protein